jgi:hypothetical protein
MKEDVKRKSFSPPLQEMSQPFAIANTTLAAGSNIIGPVSTYRKKIHFTGTAGLRSFQ